MVAPESRSYAPTADEVARWSAKPPKRVETEIPTNKREQLGERLFNFAVTHIPSHTVRQAWLRFFGARIGKGTSIMMGTRVLGLQQITIGDNCSIGSRCLLDGRGELNIADDVVIASDVQLITGQHVVDSDDFSRHLSPITVGHHVWIASRAMVVVGVDIGYGAVVGAASLVRDDVEPMQIVAGIPAKPRGVRQSTLDYHPTFRPLLY
ncbi:acyltransferase [Actinomycetes bacterium M1A6_2h]